SKRHEAVHAVGAGVAGEAALAFEVVQVGERLAEGETELVAVELAAEQHRQQVGGGERAGAGGDDLAAARLVVRRQLVDAQMHAAERQVVRRQDNDVGRQLAAQPGERGEVAGERIARRLVRLNADIGRDARQYLVAGDQYAGLFAKQAGMLRGVALADQHPPGAAADRDRAAFADAAIRRRNRRHAAAVIALALGEDGAGRVVEPGAAGEV